jgi:hypothetical protein
MPGLVPGIPHWNASRPPKRDRRDKPGDDASGETYFTGATATAMVQTSLPRLTISRLSFGPI